MEAIFSTLQFADDQVLIAHGKEDLEYMTPTKDTYESWGLSINLEKAKYLCLEGTETDLQLVNN